jgi:N6-L-threonylcarbamoyladenine synthase
MIKVLGIETSCDETAVAIVDDQKNILSHIVSSQAIHQKFGGVIPEYAARDHASIIDSLIKQSFEDAKMEFDDIDAIAVTSGPGLIGGLMVGVVAAKAMASILKKPIIEINHLEAHALTSRLVSDIKFPYLLLLLSGGHCQILLAKDIGKYEKIGETIDDALGECFDKVAIMLGLQYPGGPAVEKLAKLGNESKYDFPLPLVKTKNKYDFSFSGLKTAVRRKIENITKEEYNYHNSSQKLSQTNINDICASFQNTIVKILQNRIEHSLNFLEQKDINIDNIIISGGVAANQYIYQNLKKFLSQKGIVVFAPPINLCTDNGAMVAWAGIEKFKKQEFSNLNFKPKAKWPIFLAKITK